MGEVRFTGRAIEVILDVYFNHKRRMATTETYVELPRLDKRSTTSWEEGSLALRQTTAGSGTR